MHRIFDKTDKGREEIATRKYRLAPRLRTLLLLIDGKQSTGQLLQKIAGLDDQSIYELLEGDFIQELVDDANANAEPAQVIDKSADDQTQADTADQTPTSSNTVAPGETKFQAIQKFYSETIRTVIGLRGYNLQLKVDQAQSLDDLRALHAPYIAAVLKAKGNDTAQDLHQKLDALFNLDEPSPPVE